ncbi:ABC transporter substrate-binding protein [Paludicola sp. MB14-C6]|uniref:ABC transporter substrate-binding protein n=1 Tax=Paludihabitans sp. MB14-C6 TaxID=3070656 RepID=UPI0027DE0338|nr:ABC transporter substrate-binding protein [Paludicola sp. MB14-C6]WMJ22110.1 ABC transporter substrate-binding protein [Paludicola sp. MB14-C6]
MKKIISISLLLLVVLVTFTACTGANRVKKKVTPYPVSLLNVTIDRAPLKIASLSPSITEILLSLGYQEKTVGYSSDCKIPSEVKEPVSIGTGLKPDFEKIGQVAPEIIFTNVPMTKLEMSKLNEIGIKVVVMPTVKSTKELLDRYVQIITIMSGQIEANTNGKSITEEMQRQLDYIQSKAPETKPTFLYVSALDPIIATGDTFESSLLSVIGTNLAESKKQYAVTADEVKAMNPDMIFFSSKLDKEHIIESDLFKNSNAVKNEKIFAVEQEQLTVQNIDIAEVLRKIATTVYPDKDFSEPAPASSSQPEKKKWYEFFKKN